MANAKLRMVNAVLEWVWDPVGVRGIEEAAGEYDRYAAAVLALLEGSSSIDEVAAYLSSVESEQMGLPSHREKNDDVAALLKELHALVP